VTEERARSRRGLLRLGALGLSALAGCMSTRQNENRGEGDVIANNYSTQSPSETDCTTDEGIDDSDQLYVKFDSREHRRCAGTQLDDLQNVDRWNVTSGEFVAETEDVYSGTQSAKLVVDPSTSLTSIYRDFSNEFEGPIDISSRDVSLAVRPNGAQNIRLKLLAPNEDNAVHMWSHLNGFEGWHRVDCGPTEVKGSPDLSKVTELHITTWTAKEKTAELFVDDIRTVPKDHEGRVILTFDNVSKSEQGALTSLMDRHGFPGAVGYSPYYADDSVRIPISELEAMQSSGWDVVSHPQRKKSLVRYPRSVQRNALRRTKRWLVEHGFEEGARHLIWPYNRADTVALDIAGNYHYLGFGSGVHSTPKGVTGTLTVPRVNGQHFSKVRRAVRFAEEYGHVASIRFWNVKPDTDTSDRNALREVLRFVASSDVTVITPTTLWEEYVHG